MRFLTALVRALPLFVLLLACAGHGWAATTQCEDSGAGGTDGNGAGGNINSCATGTMTITGPTELYVSEVKSYTATIDTGGQYTYSWTASGAGKVQFKSQDPPDKCHPEYDDSYENSCVTTSTAPVIGIKEGKVTIKVQAFSCDTTKWCDVCATYDITVLNNLDSKPPEKMPLGGKYRRVDIHGVPMPDPSPTGEGEQDRIPNMAYTDMFTLAPTYAVTDVAVPMEGGELALEFRRTMGIKSRDYNPDATKRGISYPTQDYLGLGWDTNLSSRGIITTEEDSNGTIYTSIKVVDETGNQLDYLFGSLPGQPTVFGYVPDVTHSYNNLAMRATLKDAKKADGTAQLVLTKTHGTTLVYTYIGIFNAISVGNECSKTLARTERYFRLEQVIDRNKNEIDYTYKSNTIDDLTHANTVVTTIFDKAHPERKLAFDITYDIARDEGQGLDTGWRMNSVTDPLGRVTRFGFADGANLHAQLVSVTRPAVEDPANPTGPKVAPVVRFSYVVKDLLDITLDPFNPSHGPIGVNRFAAPGTITDARGNVSTFTYIPKWFPTAVYASMGNVPVWQEKLIVETEKTIDGTAKFFQDRRDTTRVTTHVVDTRSTSTSFDFTSSIVTGLPTNTGSAIIVDHFTRTTTMTTGPALVADFTWSHDLNGNLTKVIDLSGNTIAFAYHSSLSGDPFDQPIYGGVHEDNLNPYFYQIRDKPSSRTVDPSGLALSTQYFYDTKFCKEVRTIDAEGKVTDEHLDANGNRDLLTEPLGKVTRFAYDTDGFIKQTTDPDGRVTVSDRIFSPATPLAYLTTSTTMTGYAAGPTPNDVLIKSQAVTDVMGNQRTMIDPRGFEAGNTIANFTTTALFDDLNRQISVTKPPVEVSPGGALATTTSQTHYDFNGNVVRTVDDEGNVSTMIYDLMNRVTTSRRFMTSTTTPDDANDLITKTSYNAVGLPATTTDAKGFATDFVYDNMLRLTKKTLPTVTLPDNSTVRYTEQYIYAKNAGSGAFTHWSGWQPTRVINTRGFATDTTYDAIYRPRQVISRLTTTALPTDPAGPGEPLVNKTYNKVHKVLTETSLNDNFAGNDQSRTTTYTYDDLYRVVTTTVSLDGGNLITQTGYDLAGDVTSTTDAQGNRTDTTYDGAKRPRFQYQPTVTVTDPAGFNPTGTNLRPTTETRYDAASNAVLMIDANHTQTLKKYDNRNRVTDTITDVTGDGTFDATTYRATAQTDIARKMHYNRVDKVVATRDGRGATTTTAYDKAYRVVKVTQPASDFSTTAALSPVVMTAFDKDGNVTDMTDPLGHVTHTTYDQLNRVRTVTQVFEVTTSNPDTVVTESQYDAANNVTALILHNSGFGGTGDQKTTYGYDGLNRKLTETLPSPDGAARVTTMAYYRNGQLRTSTDALGQQTELEYDRAGRLVISRHKHTNASLEESRAYQYNAVGKPKIVDDLTGRTAYTYDALYRITAEVRTPAASLGQAVYEVDSGYDALGTRTRVQYPGSSRTLVSTADRAGRIVRIQDAGRTTFYRFDANGNRLSVEEPNGVLTANTLDALNRCTTSLAQNASAVLVNRYDYQFDLVGNRGRVDENLPPQPLRSTTYGYDKQYRLVSEASNSPVFSNTYTYDPAGNRQQLTAVRGTVTTVTTYACDVLNRLLTSVVGTATTTYGYDLNGNQISQVIPGGPTISFVWDTHNRLVGGNALAAGSGTATASYDYRTRRQTKTVAGATTFFRYDQGDTFQELGGTAIKQEIIRGSGMGGGIGSILYTDRTLAGGPVENFAYNTSVGHVTSLTNAAGVVTETNRFDAFGNIISTSGTPSLNNHLANTKERDASLPGVFVLDNHGMRYYNPVTGRYISRDPLGYHDSLNDYLYVNDNPINRIDPLGLSWWSSFVVNAVVSFVEAAVVSVLVVAAVAAAPVLLPLAVAATVVGLASTAKNGYEAISGKEAFTGRALTEDERGAKAGQAIGGLAGALAGGAAGAKLAPEIPVLIGKASLRAGSDQPTGGNGKVLNDGEGATPAEQAASQGGPAGGTRDGQPAARASLVQDATDQNGNFEGKCWRCGAISDDPADFHFGHRNSPTSTGGNTDPVNGALEGAACNLSAGNRGAPTPGMDCASRGGPGMPYGRPSNSPGAPPSPGAPVGPGNIPVPASKAVDNEDESE